MAHRQQQQPAVRQIEVIQDAPVADAEFVFRAALETLMPPRLELVVHFLDFRHNPPLNLRVELHPKRHGCVSQIRLREMFLEGRRRNNHRESGRAGRFSCSQSAAFPRAISCRAVSSSSATAARSSKPASGSHRSCNHRASCACSTSGNRAIAASISVSVDLCQPYRQPSDASRQPSAGS